MILQKKGAPLTSEDFMKNDTEYHYDVPENCNL